MNAFDEIMKFCPFLKETIESKIEEEVEKAKAEKEVEIKELKSAVDNLVLQSLGGGMDV